jgi:L-tartrate/succinate antiporter
MLVTKVLTWSQIAGSKQAWTVLVWFATLVAMADALNSIGFVKWFAGRTTTYLAHFSPLAIMLATVTLFFVVHYLFASLTAHTAAVLPVMLAAVMVVPGMPVRPLALLMCYALGLMGILTPYATGPGPIWYASGYLPSKDFWRMGFLTGLLFLVVLLAVGAPYVLAVAR